MYSRNNIFSRSNQRRDIKNRIWKLLFIFILLFSFLIWKIINYMYLNSESLKTMADAQYTIDEQYGLQYRLIDCKGNDLLAYEVNFYAIIDPLDYSKFNKYTSKYDMQTLIFTLRNYNSDYDLEKIKDSGNGQKIRYKIDEETFDKLKDIKGVKGFYTYAANDVIKDRYWKIENLLINTTYNKEGVDVPLIKSDDSLEMQIYNKTKTNEYTKIRFAKGVDGEISEGQIIEPENNVNVRLTLDKEIQDSVEEILDEEKYEKYGQIGVVLMESSTGKIRGMVQKDDDAYNANLGMTGTNGALPGSIFKVIVDEAGIDKDLIDNEKVYILDRKYFPNTHEAKEQYTIAEALANSSNNTFGKFGWDVGLNNMYAYAEKQGLLRKVLNLQQEENGNFGVDLSNIKDGDVSQTAIGQKIRITPLQAISIPNTIINNGIYVQPSIIDAYLNDDNEVLEKITPITNRILKTETAEKVKLHMLGVVNKGTGAEASIEGMNIGGKTGTTEYFENKIELSDGWFVGFFNLRGKNYSMVVFVKNIEISLIEGENSEGGGTTAAPIFKEIVNALKEMD